MTTERPQPRPRRKPYPEAALRAVTPIDGRYAKDTAVLSPFTSEMALQSARTEVEARHLIGLSRVGIIRPFGEPETEYLTGMGVPEITLKQARRVKRLEESKDHDVQAVEAMMREELSKTSLQDVTPFIHYLWTSEDPNNLAYRLLFKRGTDRVMIPAADDIIDAGIQVAEEEDGTVMLARTHGQAAVPTTLGKEMIVFVMRLDRQVQQLKNARLTGKLNGAVGNFNAHMYASPEVDWQEYARTFVEDLGFDYNPYTTQINPYEDLIEMFHMYQRLNGVVLDFDQDMWRYISDDWFTQEAVAGETGSSTMAQKINPIRFENSEGNLAMANGVYEALARKLASSRMQRDLSDSTVIRNTGLAQAFSLLAYKNTLRGIGRVHPNHAAIEAALQADWSTLTEGVQTYLRTKGRNNAYDIVKKAARGKYIGPDNWEKWVGGLPISREEKEHVSKLDPKKYVGLAMEITQQGIADIKRSRSVQNHENEGHSRRRLKVK